MNKVEVLGVDAKVGVCHRTLCEQVLRMGSQERVQGKMQKLVTRMMRGYTFPYKDI